MKDFQLINFYGMKNVSALRKLNWSIFIQLHVHCLRGSELLLQVILKGWIVLNLFCYFLFNFTYSKLSLQSYWEGAVFCWSNPGTFCNSHFALASSSRREGSCAVWFWRSLINTCTFCSDFRHQATSYGAVWPSQVAPST